MKVLIVEDDCIIQMFLEKVISDMGCNIVGLADNSDDGLQMVAKHSPDIILMDIGIGGKKDGIETTEIVKEKYKTPVVFITGNSDPATLKRAKATNPIHIIKKPIDEQKLTNEFNIICQKLDNEIILQ